MSEIPDFPPVTDHPTDPIEKPTKYPRLISGNSAASHDGRRLWDKVHRFLAFLASDGGSFIERKKES